MNKLFSRRCFALVLFASLLSFAGAQTSATKRIVPFSAAATSVKSDNLYRVQKIYVENLTYVSGYDISIGDVLNRFQYFIREELDKQGFTIVEDKKDADAQLVGGLIVPGDFNGKGKRKEEDVRSALKLVSPTGEVLWSNEGFKASFGLRVSYPLKERMRPLATKAARDLRKDWEKSAKKAGVKVGS